MLFQESYMRKIVAVIGIMAIIALMAYTYSTIKQSKYMYSGPTSITVTGVGEVFAKPDIATFSFTVTAQADDAVTAQNDAESKMKAITDYLKEAGVQDKDVKTEYYNLSPRYDYGNGVCTQFGCPPQEEPTLIGYEVSQNVSIKVRNIDQAGELISQVGGKGAMNVSGLSFTIDDDEALKDEARAAAIDDAKARAEVLAEKLGARIVRMNGFWEEQGGGYPIPYGADMMMAKEDAAQSVRAANLPTGENTITSRVNISYEIK